MNELLLSLRNTTGAAHQALHVHKLLVPLQNADITLNDYYWCLQAFHQAYKQMQPSVTFPLAPEVPALRWLEEDIRIHKIKEVALPRIPYPAIDNYSKYVGYLYVKQGSTLGGRLISKHLHKTLGLVEQQTNHFFSGFGEETGERWKQFLRLLDDNEINQNDAVQQAVHTFEIITRCCDQMLIIK